MSDLNKKYLLLISAALLLLSYGCSSKEKVVEGKAFVDFKWRLHVEDEKTNAGWVKAYGWVINRGTKRADWVRVTVKMLDKETGIVIDKISSYIDGSGPNGKSLEPGELVKFEMVLNTKKPYHFKYDREVTWSEAY